MEIQLFNVISAFFILILLFLIFRKRETLLKPYLSISSIKSFDNSQSLRLRTLSLVELLKPLSILLFIIGFLDPHTYVKRQNSLQEATKKEWALYLLVDQSGSMNEKIETISKKGSRIEISKIDLLKKTGIDFIQSIPAWDFIGLIGFARIPELLVPLTLDHSFAVKKLENLEVKTELEENGTALGYAIYKTVNRILATQYYSKNSREGIKNAAIIVITDGFQDPNPLDIGDAFRGMNLEEAGKEAKKASIPVYIINVDPRFSLEEFTPHRNQLKKMTEMTEGGFYLASDETTLQSILSSIKIRQEGPSLDQKSLSKEEQPYLYKRVSLYPYLIAIGAFLLSLSYLAKSTFWRIFP